VYGPVCTVVWEGRGREAPPYPDFGSPRFALRFNGDERKHDAAVPVDGVKRPVVTRSMKNCERTFGASQPDMTQTP